MSIGTNCFVSLLKKRSFSLRDRDWCASSLGVLQKKKRLNILTCTLTRKLLSTWTQSLKGVARWSKCISAFHFTVRHVPRRSKSGDALSREEVPVTQNYSLELALDIEVLQLILEGYQRMLNSLALLRAGQLRHYRRTAFRNATCKMTQLRCCNFWNRTLLGFAFPTALFVSNCRRNMTIVFTLPLRAPVVQWVVHSARAIIDAVVLRSRGVARKPKLSIFFGTTPSPAYIKVASGGVPILPAVLAFAMQAAGWTVIKSEWDASLWWFSAHSSMSGGPDLLIWNPWGKPE